MKDFFQLREAVKSADKKPENYTDPNTGKTKTRMVPVDKEVVKTEAKDPREYDYEGDMAKTQLKTMIDAAKELYDMMGDNDNLPEWVQSKITKAVDYIDSVRDYMTSGSDDEDEMNEKTLTPAELKKREEIAKAMERENPGMDMSKKMAIATATAKRVAEEVKLNEISDKLKGRYIRKATDSHQAAVADRRDAMARGDKPAADKAAATIKKRSKGVSRAFGEKHD